MTQEELPRTEITPWTDVCVCRLGAECHAHGDAHPWTDDAADALEELTRAKARAVAALSALMAAAHASRERLGVKTTITIEVTGGRL